MNMSLRNCLCATLVVITLVIWEMANVGAELNVIYTLDFGQDEASDASARLKEQGFETLLDADSFELAFKDGALNISTEESMAARPQERP